METKVIVTRIGPSLLIFAITACVWVNTTTKPIPWSTNTPIPTVIDSSLAYGIPCKPPCWQGLTPDKSTRQEVEQVLEHLLASGWADSVTGGPPWGYSIKPSPFTIHGSIYIALSDNNIVTEIGGATLFYHSVGALIEQFGDPEGLFMYERSGSNCSSCEQWEWDPTTDISMSVPVILLYPSQGLQFQIRMPSTGIGCICPEMPVYVFRYYTPCSMQEALNDYNEGIIDPRFEFTEKDLVEWHGFGGGY